MALYKIVFQGKKSIVYYSKYIKLNHKNLHGIIFNRYWQRILNKVAPERKVSRKITIND